MVFRRDVPCGLCVKSQLKAEGAKNTQVYDIPTNNTSLGHHSFLHLISVPAHLQLFPVLFRLKSPGLKMQSVANLCPPWQGRSWASWYWENMFQHRIATTGRTSRCEREASDTSRIFRKRFKYFGDLVAPRSTPFCSYVREQPTTCYP